MSRFIRYTRVLCFALCLLLGIVVLIGRRQPMPERLATLHLVDCALPCWIGITPGQTTVEQAQELLQTVYGDSSQYQLAFDTTAPDKLLVVLGKQNPPTFILITIRARPDSIIESVLLQFDFLRRDYGNASPSLDNRLSIGDLYTVFGPPSRAALNADAQQPDSTVAMVYDKPNGGAMTFASATAELTWKLPASSMVLYADTYALLGGSGIFRPWHGFAGLDRTTSQIP